MQKKHAACFIIVMLCASVCNTANAQWRETNGPDNYDVSVLAVKDSFLFAGGNSFTIYRRLYNEGNWELNFGLPNDVIGAMIATDSGIFATTSYGVIRSTNDGATWEGANTGFPDSTTSLFSARGTQLFAVDVRGIYTTTNNGNVWNKIGNVGDQSYISSIAVRGNTMYLGGYDTIFVLTDSSGAWTPRDTFIQNNVSDYMVALAAYGNFIFAGSTYNGNSDMNRVYRTSDNGVTWQAASNGVPYNATISAIAHNDFGIFIATFQGIYVSTDSGAHWSLLDTFSNSPPQILIANGNDLIFGSKGTHRSTDNGKTWSESNNLWPANSTAHTICSAGTYIYAGSSQAVSYNFFSTTNDGEDWNGLSGGPNTFTSINSISLIDSNLYVNTTKGFLSSTDDGLTWNDLGYWTIQASVNAILPYDAYLIIGTDTGIDGTLDTGIDAHFFWYPLNSGMPARVKVWALAMQGETVFAGTDSGAFVTTNGGVNWTAASAGLPINMPVTSLFETSQGVFAGTSKGIYRTTDAGALWSEMNNGLPKNFRPIGFASAGTELFVCSEFSGVYHSGNYGARWSAANDSLPYTVPVYALAVHGAYLFATTESYGVWRRPLAEMITSVQEQTMPSSDYIFIQTYPDPFTTSARITFSHAAMHDAEIRIVNIMGKEVAAFPRTNSNTIDWTPNASLPSATYFVTMKTSSGVMSKPIVLLR